MLMSGGLSRQDLICCLSALPPFIKQDEWLLLTHSASLSTSILGQDKMKAALCVFVLLGALGICCFQHAAAAPPATIILECCETFKTTPIPHSRLKSYKEAPWCPTPAVIFTNKRNMKICTKDSEEWVKAAVKFLDRKHQGGRD